MFGTTVELNGSFSIVFLHLFFFSDSVKGQKHKSSTKKTSYFYKFLKSVALIIMGGGPTDQNCYISNKLD